jgi:peptidoglycan hydrolase CwlO-like protein
MLKKTGVLLVILFFILIAVTQALQVFGAECTTTGSKDPNELQQIIEACNAKLSELGEQRNTLASQIEYMDTQIALSQNEIEKSEADIIRIKKEIKNLSSRITELNSTSDQVTRIVEKKIMEMYKRQKTNFVYTFINAYNLPNYLRSIQYLQQSQKNDRAFLLKLQNTKITYEEQKDLREEKETELEALITKLEGYKIELAVQQQEKESLLAITKNDEQKYQQILAQTRAEFEAINAIIAGAGTETSLKEVGQGEKIASIISGSSCNSSGTHLHFMVVENNNALNPFSYLKSVEYVNYAESDPFNPAGSWDWPINAPIEFSQGFGQTWAISNTWVGQIYSFHNGIDISSSSLDVKSVSAGTLYRGSYSGSGACVLPYVKVQHKDSGISTYYLHVYSI